MPDIAYIALGSNLGDRESHLRFARERIATLPDTRVLAESEVEETDPIGPVVQDSFLNQMIAVETSLEPHTLLAALQEIEHAAGRVRTTRWGPRTLDIDIVLVEGRSVDDAELRIPHPELPARDFWMRELAQVRVR